MLKKLLFNILLKRGASTVEELAGKFVRHGLTVYGGVLMREGYASSDDVTLIVGGAVAVVGVLISVARVWIEKRL